MSNFLSSQNHANQAAMDHIMAYEMLSFELGPIVNDVRDAFFELNNENLKLLLKSYRKKFGHKAADYALETYPIWKSGKRKMSGQTAKRILNLIPQFLSSEQRYDMVKKLCEYHAQTVIRHIIVDRENIDSAFSEVEKAILKIRTNHSLKFIPDDILETVQWLNDADIVVTRSMLAQIDSVMHKNIEQSIIKNRALIHSILLNKETKHYSETFKFPNGKITLQMTDNSFCFVATVVYGDRFHPNVIALRAFRDQVLLKTTMGILFIRFYYQYGADIAAFVKYIPGLSTLVKWVLDKLVLRFKRKCND